MNKRTKEIHIGDNALIELGRAGENKFRTINIDASGWVDEDATYRIIYSRPDGITYPIPVSRSGEIFSWTPEAYDVEIVGYGKLEVRAYIDDIIGKSAVFKVKIEESIQTDETQAGTVRPDWIDDIIDKVVINKIEQTVTSSEDGGVNVLTVTLTDGDVRTFEVRNGNQGSKGDTGEKGDKGDTGDIGPQGPQGYQGEKGDTGEKGADGYTPQRGVDYWTEDDKGEIVNAVLNALPNYEEVAF